MRHGPVLASKQQKTKDLSGADMKKRKHWVSEKQTESSSINLHKEKKKSNISCAFSRV